MIYTDKYQREAIPATANIMLLVALLGASLTAGQSMYVLFQGGIYCLNEGCEIVERLTRVPPLYFNLAGLLYFSAIVFSLWQGRDGGKFWMRALRFLLLAGCAAEGVLISFQLFVSKAYCIYCLIIFSIIVLLNLLAGLREFFSGCALFATVLAVFSSLQFVGREDFSLLEGSSAMLGKENQMPGHFLFFSSTCRHCEEVISHLKPETTCSIRFNPIDSPTNFSLPGVRRFAKYQPEVNRAFLKHLDINEIPVMVVREEKKTTVMQGKQQIIDYLQEKCLPGKSQLDSSSTNSSQSSVSPPMFSTSPNNQDESCSVNKDCPPATSSSPK